MTKYAYRQTATAHQIVLVRTGAVEYEAVNSRRYPAHAGMMQRWCARLNEESRSG